MNADTKEPSQTTVQEFGPAWFRPVAWFSIPLILVTLLLLWGADLQTAYERPYLLMSLNFLFSVLASLFIAYLIARSFLVRSTAGLLLIGCGVVIWGTAAFVGIGAGLAGDSGHDFDNISITIHNTSVWLSGICFLAGVILSFRPKRVIRAGGLALSAGYACSLGAVGLVTLLALGHLMPTFFVQGVGGTALRWFILGSTVVMFTLTAVLVGVMNRRSPSQFLYWYGLALALIATGLFGIMIEKVHGGPLSWVGRGAQLLSGIYMLIAAVASVRENRVWGIPLEAALQESEKRYQSLFNCMTEGFALHEIICDETGTPVNYRFLDINPAFERLTGLKRQNILGRTFNDILPGDDPKWVRMYGEVALTGVPVQFENYSPALRRWYEVYAYRPASRQFAVIFMDITARKRAEEALRERERLLQTVIDGSTSPIFIKDLDGKFISINASLERMLGISREEIKGKTDYDIASKQVADYWRTHDEQVMATRKAIQIEEVADLPDGHHIFLANKFPLVDVNGQIYGVAAISHDITERKQVEQELYILNKTLEDRVTERTAEAEQRALQLRQLAAELTLAEQRERQRISLVLHDGLQQILVAAKFQIALLEKTKDVQRLTSDLAGLIDDGIETSRSLTAELSPPILQQGGLVPALEWLVKWMRDKHGLTVSLASHGKIESAPEAVVILLFQSARELLFNVAKHAGVRTARVVVMQEADRIQVDVEDEGVGFDPVQLHGEGAKSRGMGLFSIQERLNYLGGSLEIDSAPGCGSRFKLITPQISMETDVSLIHEQSIVSIAIASQREATVGLEKKVRVILVDDHMVMRQGLAGLLRAESDIEIIGEASDGQSAIDLIRELRPDVVLMDISMPGMDGIEATRIIHNELPEVRIIGLSMFQEGERQAAMREAGAVDYLTKTGPSQALIDAIRACVRVLGKSLAD